MDEFDRTWNENSENSGEPAVPEYRNDTVPADETPAQEESVQTTVPEFPAQDDITNNIAQEQTEQPSAAQPEQNFDGTDLNREQEFVPPFGAPVNEEPPSPQTSYRPSYQPQPGFQQMPPRQGQDPVFNSTGEYRYVPPKAESQTPGSYPHQGASYAYGQRHTAYQPAGTPPAKKEKNKDKKYFSAGAVALIVVACVLLSFGAGMCGAFLVNSGKTAIDESNALVIYKTVDGDEDAPDVSRDNMSVKDVCAKVASSVVEIETEFKNSYGFYQYVSAGAGSGVIISKDGYLITNNHVIYNSSSNKVADNVTVRLNNGTEYTAKVIGRDADADIALLKVEAKELNPAVFGDSAKIAVGETVIAVGNPLGELGGTVTCGIISATNREISVENNKMNLIQIDAAVNPGNSGGGMFNMKGELVGIVNSGVTGSDVDGLGFGIPINDAVAVIEELQTHGYVTGKSYLGISPVDVTDIFTAYRYFNSQQTGVYIAQVQEGYNDKVLQYGDRVVAIDGEEVTSSEDIREAVKSHKVGDTMTFSISREGKFMDVTVTCFEYVPDSDVTFSQN